MKGTSEPKDFERGFDPDIDLGASGFNLQLGGLRFDINVMSDADLDTTQVPQYTTRVLHYSINSVHPPSLPLCTHSYRCS